MKNLDLKALQAIEDVTDAELEMLSGAGDGLVPTLTKDCPTVVSRVCYTWNGIQVCKDCT